MEMQRYISSVGFVGTGFRRGFVVALWFCELLWLRGYGFGCGCGSAPVWVVVGCRHGVVGEEWV
uniref:Uncharacterized protein n=1 Tax=Fagus sylvatica TaxID=28930 RepID=A0A2N9EKF6_FAGSY